MITDDFDLTWNVVEKKKLLNKCQQDPEDETIYYHTEDAKRASLKFRTLNCMIPGCKTNSQFPNVASLQRHMETQHEKTFCKVCLSGRTVFIRE